MFKSSLVNVFNKNKINKYIDTPVPNEIIILNNNPKVPEVIPKMINRLIKTNINTLDITAAINDFIIGPHDIEEFNNFEVIFNNTTVPSIYDVVVAIAAPIIP